jgi:NAD(P)-dependent dehydrogenase (short-subunit alcohol dehydrogenase family)
MKHKIPQMLRRGGATVSTASVAAQAAERGSPAYAAAKAGVAQLSQTAAVQYAGASIRVHAVCRGWLGRRRPGGPCM